MLKPTYKRALAGLLALASCGSGESSPEASVWGEEGAGPTPAERFVWTDCAIEFSPPPQGWTRQREQGSLEGVSFRIARVPPGVITFGTYRLLHRDHTVRSVASGAERSFGPAWPDFTLADVIDRVRFDPGNLPDPAGVVVQPEVARSVDGREASSVDYTWNDRGHALLGREIYIVAGGELFVAKVSGNEADLTLFEHMVDTIRFPVEDEAID